MTRSNIQKNNDRYNYHGSKKEGKEEGSSKAKGSKAQASKEGSKAPSLKLVSTVHKKNAPSIEEHFSLSHCWKSKNSYFV